MKKILLLVILAISSLALFNCSDDDSTTAVKINSAIVGTWIAGDTLTNQYNTDGSYISTATIAGVESVTTGTFSVVFDDVTVIIEKIGEDVQPEGTEELYAFSILGNTLTLKYEDESTMEMMRK